jgi:histidinol-phosphate aminotransferase
MRLPKGAIKPRLAVQQMAPYSPPTAGRTGKLRLDFNENTVGCSPRVIAAIRDGVRAEGLEAHARSVEVRAR